MRDKQCQVARNAINLTFYLLASVTIASDSSDRSQDPQTNSMSQPTLGHLLSSFPIFSGKKCPVNENNFSLTHSRSRFHFRRGGRKTENR